ncbi:hypothetical protein Tco_1461406 [Tanacetum coccineum]
MEQIVQDPRTGGVKRSMSMRQFILALGLYTPEEMNNNLFGPFRDACFRNRPKNYNPIEYFVGISTRNHYDTRHPPSYTTIKNPLRHLVHRLLTLSVAGRHSSKEKVTLDDLFLLHSMDGGEMVDVLWVDGLNLYEDCYSRIGDFASKRGKDEAAAAEARGAQSEEGGVRHHPNMTFTNKLRAMDDRLEFGQMRMEQERFHNWNTDHLSQLLAHHHIDHTRYDGTRYSYVLNVPDLGVHQGVNYMSIPQIFYNAPTASPNLFGLFIAGAGPSTTPNQGNDMDEE